MNTFSLSHISDPVLLRDLATLLGQERATTAALLAHLGEVDARKLYLPAAHPSMHAYCVGELHLAEDSAFKRIRAARTARRFPALFAALGQGRLHLSAVVLLAACLSEDNVEELVARATHRSKGEIERLLAERCPRLDVPTSLVCQTERAPGPVAAGESQPVAPEPGAAAAPALDLAERSTARSRVAPLSPGRVALQVTLGQNTADKLQYTQQLLTHQVSSGDVAAVLDRALDALIGELEKRKFAATARPRRSRQSGEPGKRHVPAAVKRAVWERDGGRCTFVSQAGKRCAARTRLEFDHVDEVARGGQARLERMRLRCRAHNQYGAECTFGSQFMSDKRQAAQRKGAARRRARAAAQAGQTVERYVVPWLRRLGFRPDEARRAAALCETLPKEAPLEARVRLALSGLHARPPSHAIYLGRAGHDSDGP